MDAESAKTLSGRIVLFYSSTFGCSQQKDCKNSGKVWNDISDCVDFAARTYSTPEQFLSHPHRKANP